METKEGASAGELVGVQVLEMKERRSKGHVPWSADSPVWQGRKGRKEQVSQQEPDSGVMSSRALTCTGSNMSPRKRQGTGQRGGD